MKCDMNYCIEKECDVEPVEVFFKMRTLKENLRWSSLKEALEKK